MRLFIALLLPEVVHKALRQAMVRWESYVKSTVPQDRWHVTVAFLGEVADDQDLAALLEDLSLPFLPAVTITHLGRGEQTQQLWSYAAPTYPLQTLHKIIMERVQSSGLLLPTADLHRDFVPHIHIGDFTAEAMLMMLPDEIIQATFVPKEAVLLASMRDGETSYYKPQGTIKLKA
jgi:2'-5' RNA ligase